MKTWTEQENNVLRELVKSRPNNWIVEAKRSFPNRTTSALRVRASVLGLLDASNRGRKKASVTVTSTPQKATAFRVHFEDETRIAITSSNLASSLRYIADDKVQQITKIERV